jgi:acyl-coenzyme A synthetase/AMP-(fatty) acid ligase
MLIELLVAASEVAPDRPGLVHAGGEVSRRELFDATARLVRLLGDRGVRPNDTVTVCLANSPEQVATVLAGIRLGLRMLLLPPSSKAEEIERYSARAQAKTVFVSGSQRLDATAVGPPLLRVPAFAELQDGGVENTPPPTADAEASFLLLSSGSTGLPKLVVYEADTVAQGVKILTRNWSYTPLDRLAVLLPLSHSWGLTQAFLAPLAAGTPMCFCSARPRSLARFIAEKRITILPAPPLVFRLLAETDFRSPPDFCSLRLALSSGAPLPVELAQSFQRRRGVGLVQQYGSTEAGPMACAVRTKASARSGQDWVWDAYPEVDAMVCDRDGREVPPETPGRLLVRSPGSAVEYLRDPAASAAVFQDGLVVTGDRAVRDAEGHLILLGRERPFLNVAGEKVSPGEVEACLRRHPAVIEVQVQGIETRDGDHRIRALVATSPRVSARELRDFCGARLAAFKVPREIVFTRAEVRGPGEKTRLVDPGMDPEFGPYAGDPPA